jgi:lipoprotein-anchoring transpeptidase ErfK/SrfK
MKHLLLLLPLAALASCTTPAPPPAAPAPLLPRVRINTAAAEQAAGAVSVNISLASQTAQLLTPDNTVLAEMDVSTGLPGHETPQGNFRITEKMPLKRSNLYGQYVTKDTREVVVARAWEHKGPRPEGTVYQGIAMPWWMRLTGDGVGIHVGGFQRGQTTSHGCIRCPEEGQTFFYEKCRLGTPVKIHSGPHPAPSLLDTPAAVPPA